MKWNDIFVFGRKWSTDVLILVDTPFIILLKLDLLTTWRSYHNYMGCLIISCGKNTETRYEQAIFCYDHDYLYNNASRRGKSSIRRNSRTDIFIPYILAIIFYSSHLLLMKFSTRSWQLRCFFMPRMCSRCFYDYGSYAASGN